jgi:predicted RNA-binding protein YlqC (UPF0109 family)
VKGKRAIMKELLLYTAKALVNDTDAVRVTEEKKGDELILKLYVTDEDRGRVIGKGGKTARAIRTLVKAMGSRDNKKVSVEIVE